MAVDAYTCNCQWNLNSFPSWRAYKNHKVVQVAHAWPGFKLPYLRDCHIVAVLTCMADGLICCLK